LVFHIKIKLDINVINQQATEQIQITPAHQILKRRRPWTSFFVAEMRLTQEPMHCQALRRCSDLRPLNDSMRLLSLGLNRQRQHKRQAHPILQK
jgi:hypothetical protein